MINNHILPSIVSSPAIRAGAVPWERLPKTVSRCRFLYPLTERNDHHKAVNTAE